MIQIGIFEATLHDYIRDQFKTQGCPVRIINGTDDHIHCLFLLNPKKSISQIINQVKGSTSFHINKAQLLKQRFEWQDGYGVFSVGDKDLDIVVNYIRNQKKHHLSYTTEAKYEIFQQLNGEFPAP
jgi:REP element-mobilizing transposase RayT